VRRDVKHEADVEIKVGILSISTSKFKKFGYVSGIDSIPEEDESSKTLLEKLKFEVVDYRLVGDDETGIARAVLEMSEICNVIISTGGTGITPRDVTVEAIRPLVEKEIEGFGEIFRMESYREVGTAAILSRAFAGVLRNRTVIFCLPGSKKAVELGVRIINDCLRHVVSHAQGLR